MAKSLESTHGSITVTIEEFLSLKETRKYLRGKVTRKCNNVSQAISDISLQECKNALDDLSVLQTKLGESK